MAEQEAVAKDEHAVALGRRGGKARLTKMTAEERTRIAKLAAQARWGKKATPNAPDPNHPKGPKRDGQWAEAGIMLSSRRPAVGVPSTESKPRSRAIAAA